MITCYLFIQLPPVMHVQHYSHTRSTRMELSEKAINEFMTLFQQTYGKEISKDEANLIGLQLVDLVKIINPKPMPASKPALKAIT